MSEKEVRDRYQGVDPLRLRVPLPSINRSNSYLDVIADYLDASYALEYLAEKFPECTLKKKWSKNYFPYYEITLVSYKPTILASVLSYVIWGFQYPEDSEGEVDFLNYREAVNDYEISLTERQLRFPDIVDDYLANLINGAYFELDREVFEAQLTRFPERKYGFWRAAKCNATVERIFLSTGAWIFSTELDLRSSLISLGYEDGPSLLNAHLAMIDGRIIAFSEGVTLEINLEQFLQCVACAEEGFEENDHFRHRFSWKFDMHFRGSKRKSDMMSSPSVDKVCCFVSEYHDFVLLETPMAQIVIFSTSEVSKSEAASLIERTSSMMTDFEDETFSSSHVSLPWAEIDDEIFEELCYDIIYHNPKFDRATIRKMGKSRSRDGGRDIVVQTKPTVGSKPKKYIFQCKLYTPSASVNTSNISSISDVIDQYDAQGYGIMCSCFIDATLFDRLDGIASTRSLQIETWSRFEIERYVARRPLLRERFFPS